MKEKRKMLSTFFFHVGMTELAKMEKVRNYLIDNGIFDLDGFNDYISNEQSD